MSVRSEQLRLRLRDAVVALCQEQAFYLKQLRIEGTLCVVSDQSSVLITQISEQIGDMVKQENADGSDHLPQLDPELRGGILSQQHQQYQHGGEKRAMEEDDSVTSEPMVKKMYPDMSGDSQEGSEAYTPNSGPPSLDVSQDGKGLEQASLSYGTFSTGDPDTSGALSQLEESIQDFPEVTKINGKFQCPLCEKSYAFKHSAKAHLATHNKNMKYECKLCPAKFSYASSLNGHTKKHHPDSMSKEYVCELCQQICFNLPSLKQHYTWRHKDMKVPGVLYELPPPPPPPPASSGAGVGVGVGAAITVAPLNDGQGSAHAAASAAAAAAAVFPGQHGDGGGGGADDTLDILQQVIQRYSSESQTIVQATPLQSYNQHILAPHNVPMPGNNVPLTADMTVHRLSQEQYSPQKQHSIGGGGGGNSSSSSSPSPSLSNPPLTASPKEKLNIADHFDEVNIQTDAGLYKYQCKTCANLFKSRHALYEHVNTHLGRKPFSCDTCGLTFAHHSTLYNHKRNKHTFSSKAEKEALFKFKCQQCDKRFEFPSALERHFAKYPEHAVKREFGASDSLHQQQQQQQQQQNSSDGSGVGNQEGTVAQTYYNSDPLPPIQSVGHHQTVSGPISMAISMSPLSSSVFPPALPSAVVFPSSLPTPSMLSVSSALPTSSLPTSTLLPIATSSSLGLPPVTSSEMGYQHQQQLQQHQQQQQQHQQHLGLEVTGSNPMHLPPDNGNVSAVSVSVTPLTTVDSAVVSSSAFTGSS